jgi:hypothetical protein
MVRVDVLWCILFFVCFAEVATKTRALSDRTLFPLSTRQALLQKSQQINPSYEYSPSGWSNRAGSVLTPIHLEVFTADRPFYWNRIDVGCRATIIQLEDDDGLWVHSPVSLDGPMIQSIDKLGAPVTHVVTPNYEHTKFAFSWYQNYRSAKFWGCPGLSERMPEIPWTGEIPFDYRPVSWTFQDTSKATTKSIPGIWDTNILQPLHINVELNPFTGRPFFNEVIFYHTPTKTLLTTDLFWNYPASGTPNSEFGHDDSWELAPKVDGVPWTSKLWKFGMDKVYYPFFNNFMVTDKEEYRRIAHHILNVWDVETVIPAHGDILRGKEFIRDVLTKHFQLDE